MTDKTIVLFSYGTLQNKEVQLKTFGRVLVGYPDELLHYTIEMLEIQNKDVVAVALHKGLGVLLMCISLIKKKGAGK